MGFLDTLKKQKEKYQSERKLYSETYAAEKRVSDDERREARLASVRERAKAAARAPPLVERAAIGFNSFLSGASKSADYLTAPQRTRVARRAVPKRRQRKVRYVTRPAPQPMREVDYLGFGGGGPTDLLFGTQNTQKKQPRKKQPRRGEDFGGWF